MSDINFQVKEFERFYDILMSNAPEGYKPWFFPCEKGNKNPSTTAILKINPSSRGSWHHEDARLNKDQCIEHIKQGYNIGISARKDDPLIIGDIDELKYLKQVPEKTLTATSRKRSGCHFFGWDKDGSAKINLPTDYGEMRSENQYVLSIGSYVGFDLESKKDKKAFDGLPASSKEDKMLGYYTLLNPTAPREISFEDLPEFFKQEAIEDDLEDAKPDKEYKEFNGEGKYSQLFKLKISDIVEGVSSNKRTGHPLHESDTDANFSMSRDGSLCHCWRHLVCLNPVQYLCVKAGYSNCKDAGTTHGKNKDGTPKKRSKLNGDKEALEIAYKEAVKMGLIKEWKGGDKNKSFLYSKGINTKTGKEEFGVNLEEVSDNLIKNHHIKTWFGKKDDYSFNWDGKVYTQKTRGLCLVECQKLLSNYCRKNIVAEVFSKVKSKTEIERDTFEETDINFINFNNGVWNIETKKLILHNPKYNFQYIIPNEYNKEAKYDLWLKFINECLYPEDVPVMQEWFGFNLYRQYFIKKAVICEGEQDTGKSVVLDTLIKLIGEANKTGMSLQKISGGSDFTKLSLKDKHSNIYDDLSSADLNDGGAFKVATGGGYISGEEKFGEFQQFRSFAKQMFATNKIPPVKDNDDLAYFGRYIVFKFDNVPDKLDPFLRQKLWTPESMSGILNWALEGLYRLLKNGKFSYNKTPQEIKNIMEVSGCPLVAFTSDCLEKKDDNVITKDDMYKVYSSWCEKAERPRLSKEMLGRQLTKYCSYILPSKQKERVWMNAKIKTDFSKIIEENEKLCVNTDTSDTISKPMLNISDSNNSSSISDGINIIYKAGESVGSVEKKEAIKEEKTHKKVSYKNPEETTEAIENVWGKKK